MNNRLSDCRALVLVKDSIQELQSSKNFRASLISPYGNSQMQTLSLFCKVMVKLRFHLELIRPIEEACLRGPRILGGIAPTQEALDNWIGDRFAYLVWDTRPYYGMIKKS